MCLQSVEIRASVSINVSLQGCTRLRFLTYFDNPNNDRKVLVIDYVQSRKATEQEYAINSLDLILGFVGGLSAVIFYLMELVLGNFEDFKVHNMLLGSFYGTN